MIVPFLAALWLAQAYVESPDQAPALTPAAADLAARSPAPRLTAGPYVIVQINVDAQGQNIVGDAANEPSIAVNPLDPDNMVVGWRQFPSVASNHREAGWGFTFDRGATWTFPGSLQPGAFRSDPVLGVDAGGAFYYQSLNGSALVDVFESLDGGVSWGPAVPSFGGDKNWMAIDRSGGPGHGHVYGIWSRAFACCGKDVFTRSTDGAASFQAPVSVPKWPQYGTMTVGPEGNVYAVGIDGQRLDLRKFVVARSTNAENAGQVPAFTSVEVELEGTLEFEAIPNPIGLLGQANVAVHPASGHVYVLGSVIPDGSSDPLDVHVSRSTDAGLTWSAPVRVNDDASEANWQWLAAFSVAPAGRIDAVWYDTRDSGVFNVSRLYYAYSQDGGATWSPNVAVSPAFDSTVGWPQQSKMGDYNTLVSDDAGADVAFAATFNGEQDVYYVRLFPDCNGNGTADASDLASGTSLDCDLDTIPDECGVAPACLGAGRVPETATPLLVSRTGDDLTLAWDAGCQAEDYAVYEGALGAYASLSARTCSTLGGPSWSFTPDSGDRFFLVVPTRADREGSYGVDGAGAERLPSPSACRPQLIATCSD